MAYYHLNQGIKYVFSIFYAYRYIKHVTVVLHNIICVIIKYNNFYKKK